MNNGDYSGKNFRNVSFRNERLVNANFVGSDLRGADFTGADLTGADLRHVKTGITPLFTALIFIVALLVSMLSGYVAMLAGNTVQRMLQSGDEKLRVAGIVTIVLTVLFILLYYWKGGVSVIKHLLAPALILAIIVGLLAYFSGLGTGRGMFFVVLSLLLVALMFAVGTVARATAGVLSSSILFIAVAAAGSIFGSKVGGGTGAIIMAVGCAMISKRALSGAKGFDSLRKITFFITHKYGTSFRNANLTNSIFTRPKIFNVDFTNAELSSVNWV